MNQYNDGDLVRVSSTFADSGGSTLDPSAVFCNVTAPDGTKTAYEYGVDVKLVKDDVGKYHLDVDVTQAGRWCYVWRSTGAGQAAEAGSFYAARLC